MDLLSKQNLDSVFHAYDVRGRDPEEIDEKFFEVLGKAYVTFLNAKKIAIGYDFRRSSRKYQQAFIKGAASLGCDVIDIGEIATEMIYFAAGSDLSLDGAATITASHNPRGWNGCKMVSKGAHPLSGDYGLEDIKALMNENKFTNSNAQGKVVEKDIYPDYKTKILSILKGVDIKPLKVIVDAGNGIGGKVFDYVFSELPLQVTKMFFELDDSFPNHTPNPIELENVQDLVDATVKGQADIGIALDGDGDRIFFVDNKGRNPDGVYTGSILSENFLKESKGAKIVYGPNAIFPIEDTIKNNGGVPIVCKTGHSFFKNIMKKEDALFGLEQSSHYYYKDYYYADCGMLTIAIMLKLLSTGLDFDEKLTYLYKKYPMSGEVNYQIADNKALLAKLEEYFTKMYTGSKIDHIDGLSIEASDKSWRFNIRGSNTQPLVRLNVEATTKDIVIEKFKEIEKLINGKRDNTPILEELR